MYYVVVLDKLNIGDDSIADTIYILGKVGLSDSNPIYCLVIVCTNKNLSLFFPPGSNFVYWIHVRASYHALAVYHAHKQFTKLT